MTIIDKYISKEFVKLLIFIIISFMILFLIVDFFEKIRMFISNHASLYHMASYFFFRIPLIISQIIPASVLLASLITFNLLSRHCEIIAMKANGISLYRTSIPVIIISGIICFLAFFFNEFVTPFTNQTAEYIKYVEVQKRLPQGTFKQNEIWYRGKNAIYNFKMFDPGGNTLRGITINYFDNKFNLTFRIDAERAEWKNNRWLFYNLLITKFPTGDFPTPTWVETQFIDLPEKPSDFMMVQKDTDKMGYFELKKYIIKIQSEGYDATRYIVDMHGKMAFPIVSIILVIIGISFSLKSERGGGTTLSIGIGIAIGFSYWIVHAFFMSLGRSGTMPTILSAWFANIIFTFAAIIMFIRVRT